MPAAEVPAAKRAKMNKEISTSEQVLLQATQLLNMVQESGYIESVSLKRMNDVHKKVVARLTTALECIYTSDWVVGEPETRGVTVL